MTAATIVVALYLLIGFIFTAAAAIENQAHLLGCYDRLTDTRGETRAVALVLAGFLLSTLTWPRLPVELWRRWRRPYRAARARQVARWTRQAVPS